MKKPLLFIFVFLLAIQSARAMHLGENLYLSIAPNDVECVEMTLPDDIGIVGFGKEEYFLTMTPGPYETWSDLSEFIARTDENNTVKVPLCFSSFGKQYGNCSAPFELVISSPALGLNRTFQGGVCVSRYPDFDTGTRAEESGGAGAAVNVSPMEVLNSNTDLFDVAFSKPLVYSSPGETVYLTVQAESYAELILDLDVQSRLDVTPGSASLSLSRETPYRTLSLSVQAPENPGDYSVKLTAKTQGCSDPFCEKQIQSRIIVTPNPVERASFTVSLFPVSLNVKDLSPVQYRFSIENSGPSGVFEIDSEIASTLSTDFQKQSITLGKGENREVTLTVTPGNYSTLYAFRMKATLGNLTKSSMAYLSTGEFLTDSMREAEDIKGDADQATGEEVDDALDTWYRTYRDSEYGQNMDDYSSLKDKLDQARETGQAQQNGTNGTGPVTPPQNGQGEEPGDSTWLWIAAIAVIMGVFAFFALKYKKRNILEEEF